MARTRALKDVARDPIAKKAPAVKKDEKEEISHHGLGHYTLAIAIGLVAGIIGGIVSTRILKIL
jgi:hypothetical protein